MERKVTVPEILKRKGGDPIVALTAYDFPFGCIADEAGVDLILVGDSLGMVVQGQDNTLPVTMGEMVYHCRMVARARRRALLVGDLPFLSYQVSIPEAVANAGRLGSDETEVIAAYLRGRERELEHLRRTIGPPWRAVNGVAFLRLLGRAVSAL